MGVEGEDTGAGEFWVIHASGRKETTIPLYRSVQIPVVVASVGEGDDKVDRPCGIECRGNHELGGMGLQLNPCVFFDECYSHKQGVDPEADFIFKGVLNGFTIVDEEFIDEYFRTNYSSIESKQAKAKMDKIVREELSCGKVQVVQNRPQCVHSLGAIDKP